MRQYANRLDLVTHRCGVIFPVGALCAWLTAMSQDPPIPIAKDRAQTVSVPRSTSIAQLLALRQQSLALHSPDGGRRLSHQTSDHERIQTVPDT